MKKLLALVLAMVMTLGLATVGTNAVDKFADNDSIKFAEAATVMKAIGVFDGDDNGNFRPTDTLKRSEAAKIVAYLMLTKKTADGLIPSGTRYVDVPANHWAAGYIEYLTSEGVLGGVGNGMFNPDGDITGIDFAKMLLVALGYDAKLENLVLSDYRINTAKLANSIELFEGNTDMVPTAAITRDEAVLYAFNMIMSPMVEYDSNVRVETKDGGAVTVGNNRAYQKTSDNTARQTILYKQAYRNDTQNRTYNYIVEFAEEKYHDLELYYRNPLNTNDNGKGYDSLGRPARKWMWKNEDLGTFVQTQDLVNTWNVKVTAKMVYDQLGKTVYDTLKDGHADLCSTKDGVREYITGSENVLKYINRDNTTKINGSGNGTITELYMDKDKNVSIATMNVFVYQAAADYNKNSKTLRITPAGETSDTGYRLKSNELKLEDFADIENYKADDYLLVKVAETDNKGVYEVKEIEKAEKLTGKVDSYTSDGTYSVTIDGTKHDYAVTAENDDNEDETRKTMYSVGRDATIVVDKYGYIYAVDEAIVTTDYVFITKFGNGNSDLKTEAYASAYFTDGTDSTIKVKSVADLSSTSSSKPQITSKSQIAGWKDNAAHAGNWYTYSKNASNEYTLYAPQKGFSQAAMSYGYDNTTSKNNVVMYDGQVYFAPNTSGTKIGSNNLSGSRADDKTVVVVHDDNKNQINVYTGVKNIPGISLNAESTAKIYSLDKDSSGVAKVVFVDLTGPVLVTGSANDNLIYVVKSDGSIRSNDEKNETHWQYQVLKNDGSTSKENIIADNKLDNFTGKYYGVANYASKNSDGLYTRFYAVSAKDAQSSTIAWGQADGTDWNNYDNAAALASKTAMTKAAKKEITYKNGALTVGGYGWTLADDAKITVVGLNYKDSDAGVTYNASAINTDKSAEAEFHTWISGSELNGMFNNLDSYTYDYALRTVNNVRDSSGLAASNSRAVKELYITVRQAKDGTGSSASGSASSAAVTAVSGSLSSAVPSNTAQITVDVAGGIVNNAVYVPALDRIYFTVSLASGVDSARIGAITVAETGAYTTALDGVKTVSEGNTYYFTYYPHYEVPTLTLSAAYADSDGKTSDLTLDKYVESWSVTPTITGNDIYKITNSAVTIPNEEDGTFTITLKRGTGVEGTTWSVTGTNTSVITFDKETVSGTDSLTITGKFAGPTTAAPSITLTPAHGGYTVTGNTIASSVKTTYDEVKDVSWVSTTTTSENGSATVKINVSLNEVVDQSTLKGMFTLTPSDSDATAEATGAVVSGLAGTVTFDVSGITKNINVTLAVTSAT